MKKISVIMPVYNAEKYLKDAIESILNQTYINLELIIINDGSTDSSKNIINKFSDMRIKSLENEKNMGLIYTLNKGIRKSKGEYIARMDADDISIETRFEEQILAFENKKIDICGTDFYTLNEMTLEKKKIVMPRTNDQIKANMLFNSPLCHPSVMIKKSILEKEQINYDEKFRGVEDYKLWIEFILKYNFFNLPKPLLIYRIVNTGITQTEEKKYKNRIEIHKKIYKELFKKINFNITEKELELHATVQNAYGIEKEYYHGMLKDYYKFSERIINQNKQKNYCTEIFLKEIFSKNYIKLIIVNIKKIRKKELLSFKIKKLFYFLKLLIRKKGERIGKQ